MKKDKEFKHFNRAELVEIIYQLQQDNQRLTRENGELAAKLDSRSLKIAEAGSIADAVVGITDIFAKAQEAAEYYLEEVHRNNAESESQCAVKLSEAQIKADKIISEAELIAKMKLEAAERESAKKWQEADEKIKQLIKSHEALRDFLLK